MNETLSRIGEFAAIRRIKELLNREGTDTSGLIAGIGDDSAVFTPQPGYELLVTQDSMVEYRHFILEHFTYRNLGRRAMVMNISDIGAMGGRPLYALISLGLKSDIAMNNVEDIYHGFLEVLNPMEVPIIGGNLTRIDQAMFIDITVIGCIKKDNLLRRSTAKQEDSILVTGFPGESAAGLRLLKESNNIAFKKKNLECRGRFQTGPFDHRRPFDKLRAMAGQGERALQNQKHCLEAYSTEHTESPLITAYLRPDHRAVEGRIIAESGYATAMIDMSDGLFGDLMHICEESGAGADLFLDRLPVSDSLREFALKQGENLYNLMLGASDDYELLITCNSNNIDKLQSIVKSESSVKITEIGRITSRQGIIETMDSQGKREQVSPHGWDHFSREG